MINLTCVHKCGFFELYSYQGQLILDGKPLSAITESPLFRISLFIVKSVSEIAPGYTFYTKAIAPDSDIPINTLYVFVFLEFEKIIC